MMPGRIEMKMIVKMASEKFSFNQRDITKKITSQDKNDNPANSPDNVIRDETSRIVIVPMPATKGAKVRIIGINRAKIIVFPPYFS